MNLTLPVVVLLVAAIVVGVPRGAEAQQSANVPKVGYLTLGAADTMPPDRYYDSFLAGMTALGHVEGKSVVFAYRTAKGDPKQMARLAAELIRELEVDVMIVPSCGALYMEAVRSASRTVPLVAAICGDLPGFMGEVSSFAEPGGNTTGLTIFAPELAAKRLALLKEVVPGLRSATVVWNPDSRGWEPYWRELRAAASAIAVRLKSVEVRSAEDFESLLSRIEQGKGAAVLTLTDPIVWLNRQKVIDLARERRLAAIYDWAVFVNDGGLMSYGANVLDLLRQASALVDKLLRGARPGEVPVQQPTRLELIVNLRAAKGLGLEIPPSVLLRADKVIE